MDLDTYLVLVLLVSVGDSVGMDWTILELDTCSDLSEIGLLYVLVEPYVIDLLLDILWMSKLRSEVSIVGQKKYTGGVTVKTTYWVDTLLAGIANEIHNGLTALWIVAGGNGILWLIEQDVYLTLKAHWLIVEEDAVLASYLGAELGYYLAIDLDATVGDILISLTT